MVGERVGLRGGCGRARLGRGVLRRWWDVQEDSAASWVESEEKRQISAIVSDVDMWLSRCRDAIAAPNADPSMPLKDMLSRVSGPGADGLGGCVFLDVGMACRRCCCMASGRWEGR